METEIIEGCVEEERQTPEGSCRRMRRIAIVLTLIGTLLVLVSENPTRKILAKISS